MDRTVEILFALIKCSIAGDPLPPWLPDALTPEGCERLYELSRAHDLAHLAADALEKCGLSPERIPTETAERFHRRLLKSIYRCQRNQYVFERVCAIFDGEKIDYIPLKGSVIRAAYPEPWMRTTSDIDILVREDDFSRAVELFKSKGYQYKASSLHDVSLSSPEGVTLELHHSMLSFLRGTPAFTVVSRIWAYAHPAYEGACRYVLEPKMFDYLHIAHMAEHFEIGGCGVRPFVDLWILRNAGGYDPADCADLMEEGGLTRFAAACEYLTDCWMAPETTVPGDARLVAFGNYILSGGVYGSVENLVAMGKTRQKGRVYLRSRTFILYNRLKRRYPILVRRKWLLPFFWLRSVFEKDDTEPIPAEKRDGYASLRSYLGI